MKKDCEVVRDLMPLVLDDVASDGSKHMVSAHVHTLNGVLPNGWEGQLWNVADWSRAK